MLSDVQSFYSGKTIFITGATGFLGQILLTKLLCSCRELSCIYILIREKERKSIHLRTEQILDDPIFLQTKQQHPDYKTKVKPIRGDCQEKHLGISDSDRAIIENEVDIVFHIAATINFTDPLRKATYINVRSLDTLLDIAKSMKNLKAFVYVSTAFSSCIKTNYIEEKFYEPDIKAGDLLSLVEHLSDGVVDEIEQKLLRRLTNLYPNWYVCTKLVSEDLCREKGSSLPLCIFKPGIVIPCYKEPLPGWINNLYGAVGITYGVSLGIIKVAPVNKNYKGCVVPGDYCVNALILSAYYTSLSWENKALKLDAPIINYSNCFTKFSTTWECYSTLSAKYLEKYPFYNMVSSPCVILFKNYVIYRVFAIFLHIFPAFVLDLVLAASGKEPRFKKIYQKVHEFLDVSWYFNSREWIVISNNINEICASVSDKDKELFYCNLNQLNTEKYFDTMIRGVRLYLAKDADETIQKAVERREKFRILYYSVVAIVIPIFLYFLKDSIIYLLSFFSR